MNIQDTYSDSYLVQHFPSGLLGLTKGKIIVHHLYWGPKFEVDGQKVLCQFLGQPSGTCYKALATENGVLEIVPCGHVKGTIKTRAGAWTEILLNLQEVWQVLNTRFSFGSEPETQEMVISYVQESLKF